MWLTGIPIPPSVNQAYPGKGRRYKSKELVTWENDFRTWAFLHHVLVRQTCEEFKTIPDGIFIAMNLVYCFRAERILCRNGKAKRLDLDNRAKFLIDSMTNLVGFDDSNVWKIGLYKRVAAQVESCAVEIKFYDPYATQLPKNTT